MQVMLGEQQVEIGRLPSFDGELPGHVALGRKLANGIAIHQNFHHGGALWIEVLGVSFGQLNAGEQSVVQGSRHQAGLLLFHLGEQGGRAALKNALHPTFGGAASAPLAGHSH